MYCTVSVAPTVSVITTVVGVGAASTNCGVVTSVTTHTGVFWKGLLNVTVAVLDDSATVPHEKGPAGEVVVFAVAPFPPRFPLIPTTLLPFFASATSLEELSPNQRLNTEGTYTSPRKAPLPFPNGVPCANKLTARRTSMARTPKPANPFRAAERNFFM